MLLAPPQFSAQFKVLIDEYSQYNIVIEANDLQSISIYQDGPIRCIDVEVIKKSPRLIADTESILSGDEEISDILDHTECLSNQSAAIMPDPASRYDGMDMAISIRDDLYDPLQRAVFDIITEGQLTPNGERRVWDEYLDWRCRQEEQRNLGKRKKLPEVRGEKIEPKYVAEFLGISQKQVQRIIKSDMKVISLAHGPNQRDRSAEQYSD
jgi:hypothetical protein